jgi:hypothetical protein
MGTGMENKKNRKGQPLTTQVFNVKQVPGQGYIAEMKDETAIHYRPDWELNLGCSVGLMQCNIHCI